MVVVAPLNHPPAKKIHFNLVSAGAHWAQPSAEALASRTGKLKGETKRRTAAEMLDCQVQK